MSRQRLDPQSLTLDPVITLDGRTYGTAAELADALGPDITPQRIRDWARRGLLNPHHAPGRGRGTTWYALDQAAAVERETRVSTRGRRRAA